MAKLLDKINYPSDLRKFEKKDLKQISDELRSELIDVVSETGGHLGAGLGVVELTIALHYVFNTPKDKLVWDVSHQCYPHKIITGRRDKIKTLRKYSRNMYSSILGYLTFLNFGVLKNIILKLKNNIKIVRRGTM